MTVCIAAVIPWLYHPTHEIGTAVITASDRMLTAGDIQYEPAQHKVSFISTHAIIMVAGDMVIHTEALLSTQSDIQRDNFTTVRQIAENYASHIRRIRLKRASQIYLSPLGLDENTFLINQKNMVPQLVFDLSNELRGYVVNVEALVVGVDGLIGQIYQIDSEGIVTYHHDIAFAAIGTGSGHAKSVFMFAGFNKTTYYFKSLPILYEAKKRAEVAPGVGRETDFLLISRDGMSPIQPEVIDLLDNWYSLQLNRKMEGATEIESELNGWADKERERMEAEKISQASVSATDVSEIVPAPEMSAPLPAAQDGEKHAQTDPRKRRPRSHRRVR
jgi:hypothetical protein